MAREVIFRNASVCRKGVSVISWQAEGRASAADEAADPLQYPLLNFTFSHVVPQPYLYHPVNGPRTVK